MPPVQNIPPHAKVLDSMSLLALDDRAAELSLSQRLPRAWLESRLGRAAKGSW